MVKLGHDYMYIDMESTYLGKLYIASHLKANTVISNRLYDFNLIFFIFMNIFINHDIFYILLF